jgi:integral membrane protein
MNLDFITKLEANPLLPESKAWTLYKIAALSEALGWTLLIIGIMIRHFYWPGYNIAVPIAGQIHGTLFLIYFAVLITTYTSLRWSRKKFLIAILAGIPPYGSLMFEQWELRIRRRKKRQTFFRSFILNQITYSQ